MASPAADIRPLSFNCTLTMVDDDVGIDIEAPAVGGGASPPRGPNSHEITSSTTPSSTKRRRKRIRNLNRFGRSSVSSSSSSSSSSEGDFGLEDFWKTPPDYTDFLDQLLFLLLGFRVNESHQRYLDGLKIWNVIEGNVSTLAKYILQAFPPGTFHVGDRERMLGWLVAFPVALKRELRDERDLCELKNVMAPEDLAELQNAPTGNMASHSLYVLSAYIMKAHAHDKKFSPAFLMGMVRWLKELDDAAGQCARIRRAPCAFSYVAHLRTFLFLWLFLLPFTLVESLSWGSIIIVAFVTYGVVGVELNAEELENPFGIDYNDIPISNHCDSIMETVKNKYQAAKGGSKRYVRTVGPVEPNDGERFWLEEGSIKNFFCFGLTTYHHHFGIDLLLTIDILTKIMKSTIANAKVAFLKSMALSFGNHIDDDSEGVTDG